MEAEVAEKVRKDRRRIREKKQDAQNIRLSGWFWNEPRI
jgi:hypothetical protein